MPAEDVLDPCESVATIPVSGILDLENSDRLRSVLLNRIKGGTHRIILDLSDVREISETGMGILRASRERCRKASGDLVIVLSSEDHPLLPDFARTGISRLIYIFTSRADARRYLNDL